MILTPIAAAGLALTMLAGAVTHARRGEVPQMAPSVVLFVLAAVIAWGRFGPHSF
ncbi:DoxX family protein [Nocardia sp. NPDC023852]|uniref:DoxX family protein n=1 Tax=Nocardia sp. NPDC023852 TaxID=3154697 RepID=UPI00341173FB